MARPPLEIGTYGTIKRTEVSPDRWRARARYRDHDGVTRLVERFGETGAAAERALKSSLLDRTHHPDGLDITADTTVKVLSTMWLASLTKKGKLATQTIEKYTSTVEKHINPALGGIRIREITVGRLERFLTAVKGDGTAKWCRVCLQGMFGMAARHDAIESNPVRDTTSRARPSKTVRAMTIEEIATLRANITDWIGGNTMGPPRGDDLLDLVDVMLGTGFRIGETLGLRWHEIVIDSDPPTATLTGTVVYTGGRYVRQEKTKTQSGFRTVVLPAFVVEALRRQRGRELPTDDQLVFPSSRGGPRSPANVRRQLREARGKSLAWVTPHVLRKTTATFIDRAEGVDAAAAQLGHSGARVTATHYVQRANQAPDLRFALDALGPVSDGFSMDKQSDHGTYPES